MSVRSLINIGMAPGAALSKHLPGRHDQKTHGNREGIVLLPDSLGLSRSKMPQVPGILQSTFVKELRAEGISVKSETVNPSILRPVQARINRTKVARAKKGIEEGKTKLTKIKSTISSDNFILDGHHRWVAYQELGRDMPVLRVDLNINDLLDRAGLFNEQHDIEAKVIKHLGPGDHPSGSPQSVHGGGGEGARPKKLYHVARREFRASIQKEGLRLSDVDGMHLWTVDNLETAHRVEGGAGSDIWEIDPEGLDLSSEFHPGLPANDKESTVLLHDTIPPEKLKLVTRKHLGPGDHPSGSSQDVHGKKKFRDLVGVGKPLRYKYKSGSSGYSFWETAAISRNTARQRMNALKRLVAERYDIPKDTKIEYWLDWDKYKENVTPGRASGMYPLARWEPGKNRVVISPSISTGLFDDNLDDWRVVTHELMHASSSIGDEFGLSGQEQVLEEGMAEIASMKLWADEFDLQGFADNHRTIDDGLAAMIDNSAYPEHVNNLLMHASDEVGFDRGKMWTWMEEKWRSGEYTDYKRYQMLDRGLNAEDNLVVQLAEINERADELIESLPQHAVEYEHNRQRSIDYVTERKNATWEWEVTQEFNRVVSGARAAGIDMNKMPGRRIDDDIWEIQEQELKARRGNAIPTRDGYRTQETVSNSLLYWFLSDDS